MSNKYLWIFMFTLMTLTSFSQSETGVRVFSGKCNMSQTGGDADEWFLSITNFNSVAGDASDINVGDFVYLNDGGIPYLLEITLISSASGSSASIRVAKEGVSGLSSVPTTSGGITARTTNMGLYPLFANMSDPDNQLGQEYNMYLIDSLLNLAIATNWFSTTDTLAFSPSGQTPVNGNFAWWKNRGQLMEKKNGYWNKVTSKNGENIEAANKVTVAYGALGVTSFNLSNGNYFYTSCNGDITINAINEVLQSTNNSVVIEVFNNTEDYIDATFQSGKFLQFGTSDLDGTPIDMPRCRISAFGTRLFKFTVVNLGEVAFLVSDQIDNGVKSGYYTPTLTKASSSDTIVTVYRHHYTIVGNEVTVSGRALVNNLTSTLSSSFLVSMPPFVTSNFTSYYNDASGTCYSYRPSTLTPQYIGDIYADDTQDKVSVYYVCDGSNTTRQIVNYTYTFSIQ